MNQQRRNRNNIAFRAYYFGVLATSIALLSYLAIYQKPARTEWLAWGYYLVILLAADTKLTEIQARSRSKVLASRALAMSMLVLFGPFVAVVMDAISSLVRGVFLQHTTPRKMFFNMAMLAIANGVAGLVYQAIPFHASFSNGLFLLPLFATLLVYATINSLIVTGIMSLDLHIPVREIWHRDFSWGAVVGVLELPFIAIIILLFRHTGPWTLMLYLPIIWVVFAIIRAHEQQKEAHMASIAVLATTLEADEPYTHGHSYRVSQYAVTIGRAMGMSPRNLEVLEYGGLLHDIGKIAITNDIICKPGRLTDEEFATLAEHPAIGARIVEQIKFLPETVDLVRHHHERPDGKGYPDGLKGDEITLGSSIMNICDAFDAMTSDRSYRKALPVEMAIEELVKHRGTQFNAAVVDTVLALHRRGEFDIIPDSAVEKVIRQIQRVGEPPLRAIPTPIKEDPVHEVQR